MLSTPRYHLTWEEVHRSTSLRKNAVLLLSHIPFTQHFPQNGRALPKRNFLLVIAHPDDESMFFTPTINFLTLRGHNVRILCLSIGDGDGKGNIRKQELFKACAALKVSMQRVKIVNHPDLQDGFGKVWNHRLLAKIIEEEITSHCIDVIITFDNYGVSGHCNHRDVHYGVCHIVVYEEILKSGNLLAPTYCANIVVLSISGCPCFGPCCTQMEQFNAW